MKKLIHKRWYRAVRHVTDFYRWHFKQLMDVGSEGLARILSLTIIAMAGAVLASIIWWMW